jgi:uncharacterized protein DUF927/Toprim domain-containing protein
MSGTWAGRGEAVWNKAAPIAGTLGQVYLASRAIGVTPGPEILRFLASIEHPKIKNQQFPALIARVNGGPEASHQLTYLAPDGKGKAALEKSEQRRTFGAYKGGAVHLDEFRPGEPLLIGEGVESVLTAMEATGLPGWASLGASNLPNIQWPNGAEIIILGENDDANRKALDKACPKLIEQGLTVRVATPPAGVSDFNGIVRHGIERASGLIIAKMAIDAASAWAPSKKSKNDDPEDGNFSLTEAGLYLRKDNKWNWIAQPFEVLGLARDEESAHWGKLVRFVNADDVTCEEIVGVTLLHRDLGAAIDPLLDHGMNIKCTVSARQSFAQYLASTQASERVTTAHRIGWHEAEGGLVFVLPDEIIGDGDGERIMLTKSVDALYDRRGDLADWQTHVAKPAGDHRMLRFSIAVAFAGPLLFLGGCESGLFHLHAPSSEGKTTGLRCAASVWGSGSDGGYLRAWRATANASKRRWRRSTTPSCRSTRSVRLISARSARSST